MNFTTFLFALFFSLIFLLYWLPIEKKRNWQNAILFTSSLLFYSSWNWKFLPVLLFSVLVDYACARFIENSKSNSGRKFFLITGLVTNIGLLVIIRYLNFFDASIDQISALFGLRASPASFEILVPIGISFYTLHGVSYLLDVFARKISAEKNFIDYTVFVSFFPLLIAGPVERATHLLPQLKKARQFSYADGSSGLRQIIWGLFKKLVIADNCAAIANPIFENYQSQSATMLVTGMMFFSIQIYGDFSGYSEIATGLSRLLGIRLTSNFSFPYFSTSISDFWKKWHISLSSWFRDYVYIPLGGNKRGKFITIRNLLIVFVVSGLWHGASLNFLFWGLFNAILVIISSFFPWPERLLNGHFIIDYRKNILLQLTLTGFNFFLISCLWVFFRVPKILDAFEYLKMALFGHKWGFPALNAEGWITIAFTSACLLMEWIYRDKLFTSKNNKKTYPPFLELSMYFLLIISIFLFSGREQEFIYFQF